MKTELSGFELLGALCGATSPSGNERAVLSLILPQVKKYCDKTYYDKVGNLICVINAAKPEGKTMICACADEAGFIINDIDSEGHLKIAPLGGLDTSALSGRKVVIAGSLGDVVGVVAAKPVHALSGDEKTKPTPADKLYIELGTSGREETEKLVKIGDLGTFYSAPRDFGDGYFAAKGLSSRCGPAAMCEMIRSVDRKKLKKTLAFAFTVLGASGMKETGASVAAFDFQPDEALILGALGACDVYGAKERDIVCALGGGAVLSAADGRTIYDRGLMSELAGKLKENRIPVQPNRACAGGGISAEVQRSGFGTRTLGIFIPLRYWRTANEMICKKDYENMVAAAKICISEDK